MRVSQPINLFLPANVIDKVGDAKDKEQQLYLTHHLAMLPLYDKRIDEEFDGFAPINKEKLNSIFGCNSDSYIKKLLNGEIIERDFYKIGGKSYYYRINPNLINGRNDVFQIPDTSPLFNKIIKRQRVKRSHSNRLDPHLKIMEKHLLSLEYDAEGAYQWIEHNSEGTKKLSYQISVCQIADKRFRYFKRNRTNNRLDTNFTNLKSELRQFIVGDYVQIDLRNSQPFFLSIFAESLFNNLPNNIIETKQDNTHLGYYTICLDIDLKSAIEVFGFKQVKIISKIRQKHEFDEMAKFRTITSDGNFYDGFVDLYGNGITRKEVKELMFKVLFSRNVIYDNHRAFVPYEAEKKVFAEVFPGVSELIHILKIKDHRNLAITLQKLESRLFIDLICKELVAVGIVPLTIHDSVIVPADQQEQTLEIMKDIFNKEIGVTPTFSVEPLR